ncbi:MAG: hypothetical protein M3Y82_09285 [Verrucomicrobiota bacterium]|nr:hypothetical protein [Verrucomicrobiota bacterium]
MVDNANARQTIVDTANGGQAQRSAYGTAPGGTTWLDPRLLDAMDRLANVYGYTYRVSETSGGSHSSGSYHYAGTAFDVYIINGVGVSSSNPYWSTFNQRCRDMGSIESLGPGYPGHDTHVHNAWPSGDGVNVAPSGCTGPSQWFFDTSGDGWFSNWSLSPQIWTGPNSWTGSIYSDQTGDDSQVMSPLTSFTGTADASINVQIYPQNGNTAAHDMQMFWKTDAENFLDAAKSSPIVTYNAINTQIRLNLNVSSVKWSGQRVNQLRLDFDNINHGNRWIMNHVYTQVTPKYWFGSSASGWVSGNGLTPVVWQSDATWPGIIYCDQNGDDGFFYSPAGINFLGGANDQIVVRVYPQNGGTANHQMKVYWTTASDGTWTESKSSTEISYTAQNAWAVVTLPVGANASWSSDFVTQLRLDVDGINTGVRWIIDYVAISHTTASKL